MILFVVVGGSFLFAAIAGLLVLVLARKLPGSSVHPNNSVTDP